MTNSPDHTRSNSIIAAAFADGSMTAPLSYAERREEAKAFNQAAEDLSPGMIHEISLGDYLYSVKHNSAVRVACMNHENDYTSPEFWTAYIQLSGEVDANQTLVETQSFDGLFEAVVFIRNHIEKTVMKAFIPSLFE